MIASSRILAVCAATYRRLSAQAGPLASRIAGSFACLGSGLFVWAWLVAVDAPDCSAIEQQGGQVLGRVQARTIAEASGIAASRQNVGVVWVHNDGRGAYVYGLRVNGELAATLALTMVMGDCEDIALGPGPLPEVDYLYMADIGDNHLRRTSVNILRCREPTLPLRGAQRMSADDVERFSLSLPNDPIDAETLFIDPQNGDIYIVTRERLRARVYVAPSASLSESKETQLELALILPLRDVTGGDLAPDRSSLALRSDEEGWLWRLRPGQSVKEALSDQLPTEIPVRCKGQSSDGEGISFHRSGKAYYTISEGREEPLCLFPTPQGD